MRAVGLVLTGALLGSCAEAPASAGAGAKSPPMRAFANDRGLQAYMRRVLAARPKQVSLPNVQYEMAAPPVSAPAMAPSIAGDSITNTQERGVDEGGIVKVAGDYLVVLRRGRLFTVSLAGGGMRAVDHIDAFPPDTAGSGWYDELLVHGDRIVVIGFDYQRGSEVNRFRIMPDGRLRYEDSYNLRSNDYYSSSNYASRLIGSKLVLYAPHDVEDGDPLAGLPAMRRWTGKRDAPYRRILSATRLYIPERLRRYPDPGISVIHTVTQCDLLAPQMQCTATAVLGTYSRNFYVSGAAVYVWTSGLTRSREGSAAYLYRLPFDGSAPGAVQAWGGPVDQFSFAEDAKAGRLQVLVRADSAGDAMWGPERSDGAAALLTVPLAAFGNGTYRLPASAYRPLPAVQARWTFQNRFAGTYLLYSGGALESGQNAVSVYAVPRDGGAITRVAVPHAVERFDLMGSDAVAIGGDARGRLGFSAIALGSAPRLGDTSFLPAAQQGESRSQAFFYRPDPSSADGASGMLGLPVTRALRDTALVRFFGAGSAVAFLRRDARRLTMAGELVAEPREARDDGCKASCVDWYGNARPIFLRDRVFALMGYELVEGEMHDGRIAERARVDFAPGAARLARR
ncbi:beta-propeller domain-containing protein [Sphingomonas pituitosa]|uniref:beta-propeller domain-containing protein n=1 Tax=Sphingomonas pituitosa TaxID=99597 RepID=UPI000A0005B3|nr:beta-propeller domain-containing protein [Sphingomonas pituitosa]